MKQLYKKQNYRVISVPGGNIYVWWDDQYRTFKFLPPFGTTIFVEIDYNENGGLTLPSGRKVYTYYDSFTFSHGHSGFWSMDNGFLGNYRTVPNFMVQDGNGAASIMSSSDPELICLSDMLFDALFRGDLPFDMIRDNDYYIERQKAVNHYTETLHTVTELVNELNSFNDKQNKLIHASKPVKLWRRIRFLPKLSLKLVN